MLQPLSRLQRLSIRISDAGLIVDPRTEIGNSSNAVFIDSRLIFISDVGETIEALTVVEVDENQLINNIFFNAALRSQPWPKISTDRDRYRNPSGDSHKRDASFSQRGPAFQYMTALCVQLKH